MADEDKKHDPTPHKLDEERKKGNTLKVQDLLSAAILFVSAYALVWSGQLVYEYVLKFVIETLETIPTYRTLTYIQSLQLLARLIVTVVIASVPFVLIITLTILVVLYAQVGFLLTFKPLEPKFEKIDPIKGFKNKLNPFKLKQLFNLLKTGVLISVIGYLVYTTLRDQMGTILQSLSFTPAAGMVLIGGLMIQLAKKVALFMIVVAFISYLFERWQWYKGLKMSDKEIKDEYKQMEGDPHIKAKQKQKMYQMARGAVAEAMPNADVVVTNPTHFAVALEYKPQRGMKAPVVIAKGRGELALYIRRLAEDQFIPTVEDPPTARALYDQVKVGQRIPAELFEAVAKIIATIMRRRRRVAPDLTQLSGVPGATPRPEMGSDNVPDSSGQTSA